MNDKIATISLIAAISENRGIGNENKLLWNIPEDLQRFRKLTTGHPVIMGRKTFESIGHPLVNRFNIVLSRNINKQEEGIHFMTNLKSALELAKNLERNSENPEIFIIGGGQIYKQALPFADKLYLTVVKGTYHADTYFPDYSEFRKVISKEEKHSGNYKYTFLDLER